MIRFISYIVYLTSGHLDFRLAYLFKMVFSNPLHWFIPSGVTNDISIFAGIIIFVTINDSFDFYQVECNVILCSTLIDYLGNNSVIASCFRPKPSCGYLY